MRTALRTSALLALLAFLGLLFATPSSAQQLYTTKSGYTFCISLRSFNEQSKLLSSGDRVAWQAYLDNKTNGCGILRAGLRVYMENAKGLGIIKIRPQGQTTWVYTYTEAIAR